MVWNQVRRDLGCQRPKKKGREAHLGGFPEQVGSELRWTAWDLRVRVLPKASPAKSGHE